MYILYLTGCGALGKLLHLSEPQFPSVRSEDNAQLCVLTDKIRQNSTCNTSQRASGTLQTLRKGWFVKGKLDQEK